MNAIPLDERVILALDVSEPAQALDWVDRLRPRLKFFKVGLQLFLAGGWDLVDGILSRDCKVMLDLKFFDIPETVHRAVEQVRGRGVSFCTIHGNTAVIEAAVAARGDSLRVLAVTVLTSFDESDMREMGMNGPVSELVRIRARKALRIGVDGVVCSPRETWTLRREFGERFLVVTPGIRPGINRLVEEDDQRRTATARFAMMDGADHIVVGRPVTRAEDPEAQVEHLLWEVEQGLAGGRDQA